MEKSKLESLKESAFEKLQDAEVKNLAGLTGGRDIRKTKWTNLGSGATGTDTTDLDTGRVTDNVYDEAAPSPTGCGEQYPHYMESDPEPYYMC